MKTELTKLTIVALVLLGIAVTGCGKKDSNPTASGTQAWAQADQDAYNLDCIQAAHDALPKTSFAECQTYCSCTLYEVMKKWSKDDFLANEKADTQQLIDNGTVKSCKTEAGL